MYKYTEKELIDFVQAKFKNFKHGELKKFCESKELNYTSVCNFRTYPNDHKSYLLTLLEAFNYKYVSKDVGYTFKHKIDL